MLLSITFYNYVLIKYEYDFRKLFDIYLKGIIFCCWVGVFQFLSHKVGFGPGYNYTWIFNKWGLHLGSLFGLRINSIFSEPSQFALVLLPAVFVASHHILMRDFTLLSLRKCILIYVALIMTTSSTGYIGIFVSLILIGINLGRIFDLIVVLLLSVVGAAVLYSWVPDFKSRIDSSINLWTIDNYTIEDINTSSFVLFNNSHVAWENISEHPLTGSGLGSFPLAYEKYSLTKEEDFLIKKGFDFNAQDGNSLFLRSMAEMGIIGVLFWFVIIGRFFVRKNREDPEDISWLYSSAFLAIIFGYLLRQGNYFLNGFPFFVLAYVALHQKFKEGKGVKEEEVVEE
ncbi:MAG: O-antigen ligase family protein, partial [Bacteroidia bacterium]|nr:O-antigen ligase family protein [Bacteroidia bacterium]